MGKVESLFGTNPAAIFESSLENIGEIEAVAVSVLWKDGSVTAGWSNMERSQVALMVLALDERQRCELLVDIQ